MKKLLLAIVVALSLSSCGQVLPKMYTTWNKDYQRMGSFYSYDNLPIGMDTLMDGHHYEIIQVN